MTTEIWVALITAVGGAATGGGLVSYFKERKKDNATAKLTDVQALQQQVLLLSQVSEFLRKENDQLQRDYEESEESRRQLRKRMAEIEIELDKVRRTAAETQARCEALSQQLREFQGEDAA